MSNFLDKLEDIAGLALIPIWIAGGLLVFSTPIVGMVMTVAFCLHTDWVGYSKPDLNTLIGLVFSAIVATLHVLWVRFLFLGGLNGLFA